MRSYSSMPVRSVGYALGNGGASSLLALQGACVLLLLALTACAAATRDAAAQTVTARPGTLDGSWLWVLPDTPEGLKPTQSWHATGSTPSGDIYVGGMDHATNSALYRIRPATGVLSYVGDAKSASRDADNLQDGETFEKFHTRPTWLKRRAW